MAAACCFDFSSPPVCVASNTAAFAATAAHHKSAVESGSCLPPNPFVQRVVFSPDGTCLLASADDNKLRVFEVPPHAFLPQRASVEASKQQVLSPALGVQEGETVYDAAWYPLMHVTQPATCCFVTTTRERPIHLWDAFTGKLRATYRAYNHLDEIAASLCVAFNPQGTHLYAGYNRMVRVFDITRPGRDFESRPTSKTRKSKHGQRGIISSIHFDSTSNGLYAAGAYSGSVYTYDEVSGRQVGVFKTKAGPGGSHSGPLAQGVTQVRFSPNGMLLCAGARKCGDIVCWDVRKPKQELGRMTRSAPTNQRIGFDIDASSTYLVTGSEDCRAKVFHLSTFKEVSCIAGLPDCASDAAFHPSGAILALGTGQRHFDFKRSVDDGDDSDCKDESMGQDASVTPGAAPAAVRNSVSLWRTSYEFAVADEASAGAGGGGATADVDVGGGGGGGGGVQVGEQPSA